MSLFGGPQQPDQRAIQNPLYGLTGIVEDNEFNHYIDQTIRHNCDMRASVEAWVAKNGKGLVGWAEKMGWMANTQRLMARLVLKDSKSYLVGFDLPFKCPHCHKVALTSEKVGKNLDQLFLFLGGDVAAQAFQAEQNRLQAPTPPPQPVQPAPAPAAAPQPAEPVPQGNLYCPTCGADIVYGQTSCLHCNNGIQW